MFLYKNNKLQQIRGFCTVVECKSFTKAAKHLNLSKTAVQAQVVSLERDLGCKLYQVNNKKELSLTSDGERFFIQAKQVLEALEGLFEDKKKLVQNRIRIAGHSVFMARFFPEWYKKIREKFEDIKLDVEATFSKELSIAKLISGELDCIIYPMLDKDVKFFINDHLNLTYYTLWKYDIKLAVDKNHVVVKMNPKDITWKILQKYIPEYNKGGYISGEYYTSLYNKDCHLSVGEDRSLICTIVNNGYHVAIISKWLLLKMLDEHKIKLINIDHLLGDISYQIITKINNNYVINDIIELCKTIDYTKF